MENFPPLFPSSQFLKKQLWHRIIFWISWLYSASEIYSLFISLVYLFNQLRIIKLDLITSIILSLPMTPVLLPLTFFANSQSQIPPPSPSLLGPNLSGIPFLPRVQINLLLTPEAGIIFLMVYFLVSTFLPSLIYLILLNGVLGSKWHK